MQVVDACVTDDGDCFLYGAKMVYRNLTLDAKVCPNSVKYMYILLQKVNM